ncbi:MAG: phosphatase PAP2 family protein, partial [Rhizobiaceae bacterium]
PFTRGYEFASFPSGHATTAGAAAIALALLFPRLRSLFVVAGIWVAISRPALGVHFPSDVLAGFCFGAAFTYCYARSFARKRLLFAFTKNGQVVPRYRKQTNPSPNLGDTIPALPHEGKS